MWSTVTLTEKFSSHWPDPKDQRSLRVRLEAAQADQANAEREESEGSSKPPTAAALEHGNEPSRGAQVDEEIQNEEEDHLQRRGQA